MPAASWLWSHLQPTEALCPPAPCPAPGRPGCPPLGALAAALVVASPVLHGASSASAAQSDVQYDEVLGALPWHCCWGVPAEVLTQHCVVSGGNRPQK